MPDDARTRSLPPFRKVAGTCPACSGNTLMLGAGDHVTCSLIGCPDPMAASRLIDSPPPATSSAAPEGAALPGTEEPVAAQDTAPPPAPASDDVKARAIEQYGDREVVYVAFDPDGIWAKSAFPDELITLDYNAQGRIIGVELIGSAAKGAADAGKEPCLVVTGDLEKARRRLAPLDDAAIERAARALYAYGSSLMAVDWDRATETTKMQHRLTAHVAIVALAAAEETPGG